MDLIGLELLLNSDHNQVWLLDNISLNFKGSSHLTMGYGYVLSLRPIPKTPISEFFSCSRLQYPSMALNPEFFRYKVAFQSLTIKELCFVYPFFPIKSPKLYILLTQLICDAAHQKEGLCRRYMSYFITIIMVNVSHILSCFIDHFFKQVFQKILDLSNEGSDQPKVHNQNRNKGQGLA